MSSTTDLLIKGLAKTIAEGPSKKPSAYDTSAEVMRVEGNTAWVHIPGGIDETPVQLTTNAKKGDIVQVRVSGGRAWLYGNATAPPTDDTTAKEAKYKAAVADENATSALTSSMIAKEAADSAQAYAEEAKQTTDEINAYAETAGKTVTQILEDGETAGAMAQQAQVSAGNAYNSATQAINQLSVVENIVGVLDLIAQNGNYVKTTDTEVLPDKWYFTRTGSGTTADPYVYAVANVQSFTFFLTSDVAIDPNKTYYTRSGSGTEEDPYVYTQVESPVVADIGTYYECTNQDYYELTGIDSAIQNYVSSHLVLAGNTLSLQHTYNGETTRLDMSTTNGITMYDKSGASVAQYGTDAVIGDPSKFHIVITPNYNNTNKGRISFYSDSSTEVAYISGDQLYINKSVVIQQMDVGDSYGQWSWKVHEVNGHNNMYLKWLG